MKLHVFRLSMVILIAVMALALVPGTRAQGDSEWVFSDPAWFQPCSDVGGVVQFHVDVHVAPGDTVTIEGAWSFSSPSGPSGGKTPYPFTV
jgi:hypothetical protein